MPLCGTAVLAGHGVLPAYFQQFWTSLRPSWAMKFLDPWCEQAKESGLEQMQKVAKSLQHHRRLLAN
jgi:transposase